MWHQTHQFRIVVGRIRVYTITNIEIYYRVYHLQSSTIHKYISLYILFLFSIRYHIFCTGYKR